MTFDHDTDQGIFIVFQRENRNRGHLTPTCSLSPPVLISIPHCISSQESQDQGQCFGSWNMIGAKNWHPSMDLAGNLLTARCECWSTHGRQLLVGMFGYTKRAERRVGNTPLSRVWGKSFMRSALERWRTLISPWPERYHLWESHVFRSALSLWMLNLHFKSLTKI